MSTRRPWSCSKCVSKHVACYSQLDKEEDTCSRCARLGLSCDGRGSKCIDQTDNSIAELRSQMKRLNKVIRRLECQTETMEVEVDNTVERLTLLCLSSEGLHGPTSHLQESDELIKSVANILVDEDAHHLDEASLVNGGYVWRASSDDIELESLVAELPDWPEMELVLLDAPSKYSFSLDALFTPSTPQAMKAFYAAGRSSSPEPQFLAEMFALLALHRVTLAVSTQLKPFVSRNHQEAVKRYYELCHRALDAGNLYVEPTLQGIRALWSCVMIDIVLWVDQSRLRKGLQKLPVLMSLVYALGWNLEDSIKGSALERYEQRAVACACARLYWHYSSAYGRKTIFNHRTFTTLAPLSLGEGDPSVDDKYEEYRPTAWSLQTIAEQTETARMRNELHEDVLGADPSSERIEAFIERVDQRRDLLLRGKRRLIEDEETGLLRFAMHHSKLPLTEQPLRCFSLTCISGLAIKVYERLLFAASPEQAAAHRTGITAALRRSSACMIECHSLIGPFPSMSYSMINNAVSCAVLLATFSDMDPASNEAKICQTFMSVSLILARGFTDEARSRQQMNVQSPYGLPAPIVKLIRLTQYLIESAHSPSRRPKRGRKDITRPIQRDLVFDTVRTEVRPFFSQRSVPHHAQPTFHNFTFESFSNLGSLTESDEDSSRRRKSPSSGSLYVS